MTTEISEHIYTIEIDWYAEGELIQVTPRDQERFEIQKDRVIQMLQLANNADSQMKLLLRKLGEWLQGTSPSVKTAYLTLRDARFLFVVISQSQECDDDLEDAVSHFDIAIANDADLDAIRMNAIVLPPVSSEAMSSFLDPRFLLEYSGRRT